MKVRTDVRREAIIEAAATLFQELGYERASMNELTKRLGGSKGTLYGYFSSKKVLFETVVRSLATAHLSEASRELPATVTSLVELKAALTRFSEQTLLILTNDARARAIHRLVLAEVDHSEAAQLFYESGPSESIAALGKLFRVAIEREMLRRGTASIFAKQFMSLVTAEINARVYQRDPAPLGRTAIRSLAKRAVDMFLAGAEPR